MILGVDPNARSDFGYDMFQTDEWALLPSDFSSDKMQAMQSGVDPQMLSMMFQKGGSDGMGLEDIMKSQFKFGIYNMLAQGGLGFLGGLFNMWGQSAAKKKAKKELGVAEKGVRGRATGTDNTPFRVDALTSVGLNEDVGRVGEALSGTMELDSLQAQGRLWEGMFNQRQGQLAAGVEKSETRKRDILDWLEKSKFASAQQKYDAFG